MTITATEQRVIAPARWTVDPDESFVEFAVKAFWGVSAVRGRFERFDGSYEIGPNGTMIEMTIDAIASTPATGRATSICIRPTSSTSLSIRACSSPRRASTT